MAVKLKLERIKPYEDEQGLFLSVMGKTESDIVLIGAGGQTENIPSNTLPKVVAGQRIRLSSELEVTQVSDSSEVAADKLRDGKARQTNAPKGCSMRDKMPAGKM